VIAAAAPVNAQPMIAFAVAIKRTFTLTTFPVYLKCASGVKTIFVGFIVTS